MPRDSVNQAKFTTCLTPSALSLLASKDVESENSKANAAYEDVLTKLSKINAIQLTGSTN